MHFDTEDLFWEGSLMADVVRLDWIGSDLDFYAVAVCPEDQGAEEGTAPLYPSCYQTISMSEDA